MNQGSSKPHKAHVKKTKSNTALTESAQDNLYGLDIDILKSLELDGLLQNQNNQNASANQEAMNKTMTELRQEHGIEPGLHSAANKLRMRCSFY